MPGTLEQAGECSEFARATCRPTEHMYGWLGRNIHDFDRERTSRASYRSALLVVLASAVLYTALSAYLNAWRDEIYTLRTTDSGMVEAAVTAVTFEEQPPLYFAAAAVWQTVLGRNAYTLRLLSVVATASLLCVFFRFERLLGLSHRGALGMLMVLAFHPRIIWMASEGRAYALWSFIVLAHLYLTVSRGILRDPNRVDTTIVALTALLGLSIQPFTGLVLLGESVALLIMRRWRTFLLFSLTWLVVAAIIAPVYWTIFVSTQELAATGGFVPTPSSLSLRSFVSRIVEIVVPGSESMVLSYRAFVAWSMALVWLIGGLVWIRTRAGTFSFVVLAVFEVAWFSLIRLSGTDWFEVPRYGSAVIPVFFIVLAGGGYRPSFRLWRRLAVPTLTLIAALALVPVVNTSVRRYVPLYKGGDWWRVARHLEASEDEGQPIVVFRNEVAYALDYHYGGVNEIVPFPRELDFQSFDVTTFALNSTTEVVEAFRRLTSRREYVWVVTDDVESARGVDFGRQYFEDFLLHNSQTLTGWEFNGGTRVRLVRMGSTPE